MVPGDQRRSQGLSKTERLLKRREFIAVQRHGKRFHDRLFVVLWAPSPTPWTRLGVTASRKVGNAVQRNRAKRLIREAFRRNKDILPGATDLVFIATSALPSASYDELERALRRWAVRHAPQPGSDSDG